MLEKDVHVITPIEPSFKSQMLVLIILKWEGLPMHAFSLPSPSSSDSSSNNPLGFFFLGVRKTEQESSFEGSSILKMCKNDKNNIELTGIEISQ